MLIPLKAESTRRCLPLLTLVLIAACVVAFLSQMPTEWQLRPNELVSDPDGGWTQTLTSTFLHAGWGHLIGNLVFLFVFGMALERTVGTVRFGLIYAAAAVAAGFTQAYLGASGSAVVGASGAIAGVLGAYASIMPQGEVRVLNPLVPLWFFLGLSLTVPAWAMVLVFLCANLLGAFGAAGTEAASIAVFSHLGGLVAGLVLGKVLSLGVATSQGEG
jgi:membrane associated rhomboid family serine protease